MADPNKKEVLNIQKEILNIQKELLKQSDLRTDMSATRSYHNAERTLSVWIRTALSAMIFGLAIDRFGLMLRGVSEHPQTLFGHPSTPTTITGAFLVLFSVIMSLSAGLRYVAFYKKYKKKYPLPYYHNVWLPGTFAFMTALFGIVLFILMWGIV